MEKAEYLRKQGLEADDYNDGNFQMLNSIATSLIDIKKLLVEISLKLQENVNKVLSTIDYKTEMPYCKKCKRLFSAQEKKAKTLREYMLGR